MAVVKSTSCSSRGPEFRAHCPYGRSQPSVPLVPRHRTPVLASASTRPAYGAQILVKAKYLNSYKLIKQLEKDIK